MKPVMLLAVLAVASCAGAPPREPNAAEKAEVTRIANMKTPPERAKGAYRVIMKNGEKHYCQKEVSTGSHVNYRTICLTERDYLAMQDKAQQQMDEMRGMPIQDPGMPGRTE
jgi:hypothetical protein